MAWIRGNIEIVLVLRISTCRTTSAPVDAGYQVMVTSDHGMNDDLSHGGILPEEREVPLFVIGDTFTHAETTVKQTELCGLCCQLLGLEHCKPYAPEMIAL